MSGRGGSYSGSHEPGKTLSDIITQVEGHVGQSEYAGEVNDYLKGLLAAFNDRDVDAIRAHADILKTALERDIEGTVDLVYGGSVRKHTYLDGLSDVDLLVRINGTSLEGKSPAEVLSYFADRIRERLPNTNVTAGTLAVTVRYSDGHELQILPAVTTGTGVRISAPTGDKWSSVIRPEAFAAKLTEVNQQYAGRIVPVVKLFKAVQAALPGDVRLSGYHVESLAISAFRMYGGNLTYKDMLAHMCRYAVEAVKKPISDRTGQSLHVDDYLGVILSQPRLKASAYLDRIAKKMETADIHRSLVGWEALFGNE